MRAAFLLLAWAAPAWAEAPVTALLPPPRPAEVADGTPEVLARILDLPQPAVPMSVAKATRGFLPVVPRRPPGLGAEPPAPPLDGPPQEVRAEEAMQDVAPLEAVPGGWEGVRPVPRPAPVLGVREAILRPLPRPAETAPRLPPDPEGPSAYEPPPPLAGGPSLFAVAFAVRPPVRPPLPVEEVVQVSARATPSGSLCGVAGIDGDTVAPVLGRGGCGIDQPVRVSAVDGVRLTEGSLMDCTTAEALLDWVREGARPAVGERGGGIAGLRVFGHYSCRPRNNQSGARLSEHGLGRAIDIGAVLLADGTELSLAGDWPDPALVAMHEAACGIFSTTLGPGSDGFHEDHLHYDTAPRGNYCR